MTRLALEDFPQLPDYAYEALKLFKCTVPQSFLGEQPHNVIAGSFAAPGQLDFAVLCSVRDTSSIVVVWGGETKCSSRVAALPDRTFAQNVGGGLMGYSRVIQRADSSYILEHAKRYNGPQPPTEDHDGINDVFVEKGSVVHFCHAGEWIELQGAD